MSGYWVGTSAAEEQGQMHGPYELARAEEVAAEFRACGFTAVVIPENELL